MDEDQIIIEGNICKSISGQEDENGNYIFEVEASNENLDLQNQRTLQSALQKSKEYFVTNGVISDDHLHKTRNPDGSVETHKEKIIGEPVSVRFDPETKQTFVKGVLYAGIEAAKPYIDLLKNKSRLVKASIGGIMPKIKKNADGSETVTSFMWNDLALTCSPVNWTVGSAKFAKSIGIVDFCKSLNAGSGADASNYTDGRCLQNEDCEKKTAKLQKISENGNLSGDDENDDFEKSDEIEVIKSCIQAVKDGELNTKEDMEMYLKSFGIDKDNASDISLEIIRQGGKKGIMKSSFSSTIDDLLKSFSGDEEEDKKKKKMDSDEEENTLFDDDDTPADDSEDEEVEKCGVKKSFDDDDSEYLDATDLMKSMAEKMDALESRNADLEKSLAEIQDNMISVTKSFGDFLKTPNTRNTVVEKSLGNSAASAGPTKRPTNADFDIFKSALVEASKAGEVGLDKVQFLNSEFQKSMSGQKISAASWNEICSIVKKHR